MYRNAFSQDNMIQWLFPSKIQSTLNSLRIYLDEILCLYFYPGRQWHGEDMELRRLNMRSTSYKQ